MGFKDTSIPDTSTFILFDNKLQKCYNTDALSNVVHRRITKKALTAFVLSINRILEKNNETR